MSRKRRVLTPDEYRLWERVKHTARPLGDTGHQMANSGETAQKPPVIPITSEACLKVKTRPAISDLDRRTGRRLRRGNTRIEMRLDLHGQTQGAAHHALRSFLHSARRRGAGFVLVITGKSGILNRLVPLWLNEPGMRAYVSAISPAGPRHGGHGALYVRLRKS